MQSPARHTPVRHAAGAIVLAVSAIALAACASPTPYQPLAAGEARGGYTTQRLESDRFRVNFVGNTLTSRERVENYLLYRAAQLTQEQGYGCFTIVQRDVERDQNIRVTPSSGAYAGWAPYWRFHGVRGWRLYDPWIDGAFWPASPDIDTSESYEATAEIVLSRAPCRQDDRTFSASQVTANLSSEIVWPS